MSSTRKQHIQRAANALTDLSMYAAVQTLLENSLLRLPESNKAAQKIIAICWKERQRCLDTYDSATEAALRD